MSNRTANDNVRSFQAIGEDTGEGEGKAPKPCYSRSKSVASGLPRLGNKTDDLKSRRNNMDGKGLNKFFKQVKNLVSKDKLRKTKVKQEQKDDPGKCPASLQHRHQSQSYLTPRKLRPFQHHSTPRLIKDI